MSLCHVTRCGAWLNSTAQSADTIFGEVLTPHLRLSPALPLPWPSLALSLGPSWPCPPPGAGHRWGPHPLATAAAFPCIRHGSSLRAGIGTWTTAAPTPTPAQLPTATTGEVRTPLIPAGFSPLWAVYLALTPGISTSGALSTRVSACFVHMPPKACPHGHFQCHRLLPPCLPWLPSLHGLQHQVILDPCSS